MELKDKKGFITKSVGGNFWVFSNETLYQGKASRKLKDFKSKLIPGDEVIFDIGENNLIFIKSVLERKNELQKPKVANIDQVLIIMSLKEPDFSLFLLDKYLLQVIKYGITPIIYITKKDLVDDISYYQNLMLNYQRNGYRVLIGNNHNIEEIRHEFEEIFKDKKTILSGQSAAGKSTFLNALDSSLNAKVGEYSASLGRGRHTTRETNFIRVLGGFVADTPGFSSLELNIEEKQLSKIFPCFKNYVKDCYYKDCFHDKEKDCGVKRAILDGLINKETYQNYLKMLNELRTSNKKS